MPIGDHVAMPPYVVPFFSTQYSILRISFAVRYDGDGPDRDDIWQYASDEYAAASKGDVYVVRRQGQ